MESTPKLPANLWGSKCRKLSQTAVKKKIISILGDSVDAQGRCDATREAVGLIAELRGEQIPETEIKEANYERLTAYLAICIEQSTDAAPLWVAIDVTGKLAFWGSIYFELLRLLCL